MTVENIFSWLLIAAGIGHFVVLIASVQVPRRFNWKEELARLRPLNRKIMWVYGGFTVLTIIAFGVMTLALRTELLRGDRAALALATFICIYWFARLLIDFFYYEHSDWPAGRSFVIGHILIVALFAALVLVYGGLVVWHLCAGAA
jgi:uncharacterized MAPEG superfamily protein